MPSVYQPRRPRASPLWQIVHHAWNEFLADYESCHRKAHGPLRRNTLAVVEKFYRCGDLSQGFTRLQCPDCGHEKLLAFSCKGRHPAAAGPELSSTPGPPGRTLDRPHRLP